MNTAITLDIFNKHFTYLCSKIFSNNSIELVRSNYDVSSDRHTIIVKLKHNEYFGNVLAITLLPVYERYTFEKLDKYMKKELRQLLIDMCINLPREDRLERIRLLNKSGILNET